MPHRNLRKGACPTGDGGWRRKPAVFSSVASGRLPLLQNMCPISIWVPIALIRFSELLGGSSWEEKVWKRVSRKSQRQGAGSGGEYYINALYSHMTITKNNT